MELSPTTRRHVRRSLTIAAAVAITATACGGTNVASESAKPPAVGDTIGNEGPPQNGGALVVGVTMETSGWNQTYDRWGQMGALIGSTVLEPLGP